MYNNLNRNNLNNNLYMKNYNQNYGNMNDERFGGFFVPFLLGGLTGGAAVAVSRPRPVYVNPYQPYQPYPSYPSYYGPRPY